MLTLTAGSVEITDIVHDRMHVQIHSPILRKSVLNYRIESQEETVLRKGSFHGPEIQLNMTHMPDGDYVFLLTDVEGTSYKFPFFKRALHGNKG
ncbi:MAG: hypothetical protein ABL870_04390 [Sediminibacterium sp.]